MNTREIQQKVREYENFLEDVLKHDLREIEQNLSKKAIQYKEWDEVKVMADIVKEFKEKNQDMLVQIDIGKGIMVNGEICNYDQTFVNIGLGIILEMDCEESVKYSDIRLRLLKKEITHFRKLAVDVKVHIKMVLLAISELQKSIMMPQIKMSNKEVVG